jgi:hypothetical protein
MSKTVWHRQCRYQRDTEDGTAWNETWLPEKLSKVGKKIYFDNPDELYTIIAVGTRRRTGSQLREKQNADKNQRNASDV